MAKYETHIQNVKNHLNNGLSITSWEAIELYHCTRLSAVIYSLKDRHSMLISSEMVDSGDGTRYARYTRIANPNQKREIKAYMMDGNDIDAYIAREKFGCDHLKVVVSELKSEGCNITYKMWENEKGVKAIKYKMF